MSEQDPIAELRIQLKNAVDASIEWRRAEKNELGHVCYTRLPALLDELEQLRGVVERLFEDTDITDTTSARRVSGESWLAYAGTIQGHNEVGDREFLSLLELLRWLRSAPGKEAVRRATEKAGA